MRLQPEHLATLLAHHRLGGFDAAGRRRHATLVGREPAGQGARGRGRPARAHPRAESHGRGRDLVRLARQQGLARVGGVAGLVADGRSRVDLPFVVNADRCRRGWCGPDRGGRVGRRRLRRGSRTRTTRGRPPRSGEVLGAVTSDPTPVQGRPTERLVMMRYPPRRPRASPTGSRWTWDRLGCDVPRRFNDKDDSSSASSTGTAWPLRRRRTKCPRGGFVTVVRSGLGWGALLTTQSGRRRRR